MFKAISFRTQLDGEILQFLKNEGIECVKTIESVAQAIVSLSNYHEEGTPLFPKIFLLSNIEEKINVLAGRERIQLGVGNLSGETVKSAIKTCSPLAKGGWSIYLDRTLSRLSYGVFTATNQPLSLSPTELLMTPTGGSSQASVLLLEQIAESLVEVRTNFGNSLHIHLSGGRIDGTTTHSPRGKLIESIVSKADEENREFVSVFLNRVFSDSFHSSHGTLCAVLSERHEKVPKFFRDSVILPSKISIVERVAEFRERHEVASMARLQSIEYLIRGMIQSDGITLFGSDASIVAFRAFLKNTAKANANVPITGGARRRTFQSLCSHLDKGDLTAAYYQSHDGHTECKRDS